MTDGPSGRRPGKRGGGRDGDGADIRFYGRRKGHTLRDGPRQRLAERLPQLTIDISQPPPADLRTLFPRPVVDVYLEIGFGTGEHIVWQAGQHPDIGYIGAEPFLNGLSRFVAQAEAAGVDNISIHPEDGRPLLDWLPPASIGRAYVLYPDPWPKRRHLSRRFINDENLARLARVLRPQAELLVATDIGDYVRSSLSAVFRQGSFHWLADTAADWRQKSPWWPETRYESKARNEGRRSAYLRLRRLAPAADGGPG